MNERSRVFAGDFIDRGPQITDVLGIVRTMVDEGDALAVIGNHEFNAIAFHTPKPENTREFLWPRTDKNILEHGFIHFSQLINVDAAGGAGVSGWLFQQGLPVGEVAR